MKEQSLSDTERAFVQQGIKEHLRIDGRTLYQYRDVDIVFGSDVGCCLVSLGDTRVMCQVSSDIQEPSVSRPNEGKIFINVELSPMAAQHFEVGRLSPQGVELTRILERAIKESRCVDMESLCIVADEKVWVVRVDIHILNAAGNLQDCASVAAIAALTHFTRPDVSKYEDELIIHPPHEKKPLPLNIHHTPYTVTFAFFHQGSMMIMDPSELEERVMEGKLVVGINPYKETCVLHLAGSCSVDKQQIIQCTDMAFTRVKLIANTVKEKLKEDAHKRSKREAVGFSAALKLDKLSVMCKKSETLTMALEQLSCKPFQEDAAVVREAADVVSDGAVVTLLPAAAASGAPVWTQSSSDDDDDESSSGEEEADVEAVGVVRPEDKIQHVDLDDSEEEEVHTLQPQHLGFNKKKGREADGAVRKWYSDDWPS